MSRSLRRSKCRRAGCLLCCPWTVSGERPVAEQRATQDSVSVLVEAASDDETSRLLDLAEASADEAQARSIAAVDADADHWRFSDT